ncbi:MAG: SRPBCC family protein [Marmoricola sp.]
MSTMTNHPETTIDAPAGVPWIDLVREFDATPDKVFRAHTDPELLKRWLGPRDLEMTVEEFDARTGGRYAYTHRRGDEAYQFYGSFHEVRENQRIVQTFTFRDDPDAVAVEVLTLEPLPGGRTRLVIRSVGTSVEDRDSAIANGMERGIVEGYEKLDELLAER